VSAGLRLKINIQQDEYIGTLSEPAGVRIAVHDQRSMPFPEDSGLYASVGQLTSFSLTKVDIGEMHAGMGMCAAVFSLTKLDMCP
jgi:hypothetical protein